MGVRDRPDHGGGGGFGTKLLQLVTFQYILIPKCNIYCQWDRIRDYKSTGQNTIEWKCPSIVFNQMADLKQ